MNLTVSKARTKISKHRFQNTNTAPGVKLDGQLFTSDFDVFKGLH